MKLVPSYQKIVAVWTLGLLFGLVLMAVRDATGIETWPMVLIGPSFLLWRHLRAMALRRLVREAVAKAGTTWVKPEIEDGRLVWSDVRLADPVLNAMSMVVGPPLTREMVADMARRPPFVVREPVTVDEVHAISDADWEAAKQRMKDAIMKPVLEARAAEGEPVSPRWALANLLQVSPVRSDFALSKMRMSGGGYYDFAEPGAATIAALVAGCVQTPRFGGQMGGANVDAVIERVYQGDYRWSVAHHSLLASWVAWLASPVDVALIGEMAGHDAHEGVFGDMPSPLKTQCADYRQVEKVGARAVRAWLGTPLEMTASARVIDGLCLVAEARLVFGDWPYEWASAAYIECAKAMKLEERAELLQRLPEGLIATAFAHSLTSKTFVEDHLTNWEFIYSGPGGRRS